MRAAVEGKPLGELALDSFRLLVDSVRDYAIFMLDAEGRVLTWNRGAERIKGYRPSEIVGRHFSVFYTQEDLALDKPARELETAVRDGRVEDEGWRVRKDGTKFRANVVITALYDEEGRLRGFGKVTRDVTERRRAEEAERQLLAERVARAAGEANEQRLREEHARTQALSRRLQVILESIADGVTVQERSGKLVFANTAAARAGGYPSAEALLATPLTDIATRFDLFDEHGAAFAWDDLPGRRVLAGAPEGHELLRVVERATGLQRWMSFQSSPIRAEDGTVELAVNVWHDVTDARRREEHERYLAGATSTLGASLDYETTLRTLADLLVPGLADWCVIHLLEGEDLRLVAVAHADPARAQSVWNYSEKFPPQRGRGVWQVIETGRSLAYEELTDELLQQGARSEEHLELLRHAGMRSLLLVPLRTQQRTAGVLTLVSAVPGRRYGSAELALAEELGLRAGAAIAHARLYEAERRARGGLELVARAGEMFSSTLDYEHTLTTVADIALPGLADFAFFDIVEGERVRRVAAAHDDPEVDALIKASQWVRSERTDLNLCALSSGASGFHPRIDAAFRRDIALSAEHLAVLERIQLASMITVPLRAEGQLLGSLMVCYGKSGRHHTTDDLRTAEELARRAAIAVLQARLFAEAREAARAAAAAAKAAEEASTVKDEFLATVSHELRTPLNAIIGWASLLRADPSSPAVAKGLDVIFRNGQAQAKIIDDILDVSRIITGKLRLELESTDLVAVVRDAIEVVRPSASAKRIAIDLRAPASPCVLIADRQRLQQVVWNLLSNAVKFTPPEGSVKITAEQLGGAVSLEVEDSGSGIEEDLLPFIFDRFKQGDSSTTRRVGGLGLGLSIVRQIVELHGGRVAARSPGPGCGATFALVLPVRPSVPVLQTASPASQRGKDAPESPSDFTLQNLRVLLVEDEPDARELLQVVLEGAGATVQAAASAGEALALLEGFRPQLLISDIGMPGEDGYSLIEKVRARGDTLPAVALTAYTRREDRAKALAAGFTSHLGKPVWPEELLATISNLAAKISRA